MSWQDSQLNVVLVPKCLAQPLEHFVHGLIRGYSIVFYPELEVLAIYVIVIAVLLWRPAGLFGRAVV